MYLTENENEVEQKIKCLELKIEQLEENIKFYERYNNTLFDKVYQKIKYVQNIQIGTMSLAGIIGLGLYYRSKC